MAPTSYHRLFKSISEDIAAPEDNGGPSVMPLDEERSATVDEGEEDRLKMHDEHFTRPLKFVFEPDLRSLLNPPPSSLVCALPFTSSVGFSSADLELAQLLRRALD